MEVLCLFSDELLSSLLALTPNFICMNTSTYMPTEMFSLTKVNFFLQMCQFLKKIQSSVQILACSLHIYLILYTYVLYCHFPSKGLARLL